MLLAINWHCWQARKNSRMRMKVQSLVDLNKRACMRRHWIFIRMREFFPPVNSASWWKAAFEWSSVLSSDFHCKQNDGFRGVPIHPGLITSDYGVQEVGVTVCGVQHVLGVRVRPGNQIVFRIHVLKKIKFVVYSSQGSQTGQLDPIVLMRLGGPRSRPNPHLKFVEEPVIEPATHDQ